jgi:hypothetical protein
MQMKIAFFPMNPLLSSLYPEDFLQQSNTPQTIETMLL